MIKKILLTTLLLWTTLSLAEISVKSCSPAINTHVAPHYKPDQKINPGKSGQPVKIQKSQQQFSKELKSSDQSPSVPKPGVK